MSDSGCCFEAPWLPGFEGHVLRPFDVIGGHIGAMPGATPEVGLNPDVGLKAQNLERGCSPLPGPRETQSYPAYQRQRWRAQILCCGLPPVTCLASFQRASETLQSRCSSSFVPAFAG
ncbi:hypothetical protein NDU88_010402 [Pleurodeles waltl]|uniref:Uncharacterized protein n=1 Tax=Pleurodeles waltl TaxID=8319 RepID=A0AAV7PUT6_PLEWA|nr:hypothetical protein NDU88_010402 [Pleurodeles waltl]